MQDYDNIDERQMIGVVQNNESVEYTDKVDITRDPAPYQIVNSATITAQHEYCAIDKKGYIKDYDDDTIDQNSIKVSSTCSDSSRSVSLSESQSGYTDIFLQNRRDRESVSCMHALIVLSISSLSDDSIKND